MKKQVFTFRVVYFKGSGKFYTETTMTREVRTDGAGAPYMPDVVAYLRGLRDCDGEGSLPGLSGTWAEGFILVDCEQGYPCLIPPAD